MVAKSEPMVPQCQIGFINVLVKPLFHEYTSLLGERAIEACMGALQANLEGWEQHGNELMSMGGRSPTSIPTLPATDSALTT